VKKSGETKVDTKAVRREGLDSQQRKNRRRNRGLADRANWTDAHSELVVRAISAVAAVGGALRFGYTTDGGAFAVGVLGDGEPYTDFVRPTEDINLYLIGLAEDFEESAKSVGG